MQFYHLKFFLRQTLLIKILIFCSISTIFFIYYSNQIIENIPSNEIYPDYDNFFLFLAFTTFGSFLMLFLLLIFEFIKYCISFSKIYLFFTFIFLIFCIISIYFYNEILFILKIIVLIWFIIWISQRFFNFFIFHIEVVLKILILNIIFFVFNFFWLFFDKSFIGLQFIFEFNILAQTFTFGIDQISLLFILLTVVIFSLCIWYNIKKINAIICLLILELLLILTFYCTNLLAFYIFFESILIPMFILIIYWGSRMRKIKAAYYLFIYTMIGSFFMLYGIYYLYLLTGSLNYMLLLKTVLFINQEYLLWICFFIAFAIKIPIFPFHIWLPEAHVEAPTIGSVILASLLLKLGGYGFIRFTIPLVPIASQHFQIIIFIICILSILYASIITIRQIDLKKIIAYSSIAHMNIIVLGIFTLNKQGITGGIYLMIAHGITASALFFCIGMLYDRYQTRLIFYFGGLVETMPIFSFFFLIFTLSNMGFPGTCNFVGELLVLYSLIQQNLIATIFSATGIIFSAIYSIWLYNRIIFGTVKILYIQKFNDLTKLEFYILFLLTIFTFIFGLNANLILDFLN